MAKSRRCRDRRRKSRSHVPSRVFPKSAVSQAGPIANVITLSDARRRSSEMRKVKPTPLWRRWDSIEASIVIRCSASNFSTRLLTPEIYGGLVIPGYSRSFPVAEVTDTTTKRFEFVGGGSDKFWEITPRGTEVSVRFGRNGTQGHDDQDVPGRRGRTQSRRQTDPLKRPSRATS